MSSAKLNDFIHGAIRPTQGNVIKPGVLSFTYHRTQPDIYYITQNNILKLGNALKVHGMSFKVDDYLFNSILKDNFSNENQRARYNFNTLTTMRATSKFKVSVSTANTV